MAHPGAPPARQATGTGPEPALAEPVDVFGDLHGDRGPDGTGFIPKRSAFSSPVQPGPECPFRGASTSRPRVDSACHSYRSALESRSALAVVSALLSAGARAAIAAGPSTAARRRRHRRRGDAVDWLWAAAFCGSATRASARARAMLWWYTVASWAPVVLSSINLGQGANRSPTARQQAAIRGRRVGAHAT
jgi:hypothetical protein